MKRIGMLTQLSTARQGLALLVLSTALSSCEARRNGEDSASLAMRPSCAQEAGSPSNECADFPLLELERKNFRVRLFRSDQRYEIELPCTDKHVAAEFFAEMRGKHVDLVRGTRVLKQGLAYPPVEESCGFIQAQSVDEAMELCVEMAEAVGASDIGCGTPCGDDEAASICVESYK